MFIPHPDDLDLDRLHHTIEKLYRRELFARREGQTVARIYAMVGELELGDDDNEYLYVAETHNHAKLVAWDFLALVRTIYPQILQNTPDRFGGRFSPTLIILPNGQTYRFLSVDRLITHRAEDLRGRKFAKIFYDVSGYGIQTYVELHQAKHFLYSTGAEIL